MLVACGGGKDKDCTAGATAPCTCTDGASGTQTCGTGGTFGACSCDEVDAGIDAPAIDAMVDAPSGPCDPLAAPGQQNCAANHKCTWIQVEDSPQSVGQVGCVPDGTVALGGACTRGPVGATTGFDNCVAGAICIGGTCSDICGFDNSANAACAAGYQCTPYEGLFENGDDPPAAGVCNPSCNPVTQQVTGGGTCGAGNGCYLVTNQTTTIAVCAGAGAIGHNETITGQPFANSCLPGHQPRRADGASTTMQCGALCQVTDVTATTNTSSEGGVAPDTCASKGAAPPESATAGESCRYFWAREPFEALTPYSNTVGWCFKHAVFQYDSNGDMQNDAPFPRCIALTTGDVVPPIANPPHNDAEYFWCAAKPAAKQLTIRRDVQPALDRLTGWR